MYMCVELYKTDIVLKETYSGHIKHIRWGQVRVGKHGASLQNKLEISFPDRVVYTVLSMTNSMASSSW